MIVSLGSAKGQKSRLTLPGRKRALASVFRRGLHLKREGAINPFLNTATRMNGFVGVQFLDVVAAMYCWRGKQWHQLALTPSNSQEGCSMHGWLLWAA